MDQTHKESNPPKLLKSDTRQWTSGRVKLAVIGWEDKPEENYIVLEKLFFGKNCPPNQKFILRSHDWINLKKLIDGDLQPYSAWEKTIPAITEKALAELITQSPDSLEKILENLNILKSSDASLESLDRIAIKLFVRFVCFVRFDYVTWCSWARFTRVRGNEVEYGSNFEDT